MEACLFLLYGAKDQLLSKEKSRLMYIPPWRSTAGIHFPKRTIREKILSKAIFPSTHFITLHIIGNLRVFLFSFYDRRFTIQRRSFLTIMLITSIYIYIYYIYLFIGIWTFFFIKKMHKWNLDKNYFCLQ